MLMIYPGVPLSHRLANAYKAQIYGETEEV